MKLATWNVNSLSVRLPQVLDWLQANPVDVLALQELKLTDDKFPAAALQQAGYHAECFGQKTYNGVALLSRAPIAQVVRNIPGFDDPQQRVIAATLRSGSPTASSRWGAPADAPQAPCWSTRSACTTQARDALLRLLDPRAG